MAQATQTNSARTVVITGASSGIGRATALGYAEQGCRLALAARGSDALHQVAMECLKAGAADVLTVSTDISDQRQVQTLLDETVAQFGDVDVVVQNAAVAAFGRFTDVPSEIFDMVIRINVLGAANVARSALRYFGQRGRGHLVIVGSLLGHAAVPYMGPYVISKFAVSALIRTLRQEIRDQPGIAVHGIYPGAVDTPVYGAAANYFGYLARVLPINDPPAKVARRIVASTEAQRSDERQVGVANWPMLLGYRLLPRVFDLLVDPLMRAASFTRAASEATPGNVLESAEFERKLK